MTVNLYHLLQQELTSTCYFWKHHEEVVEGMDIVSNLAQAQ